MTETSHLLTTKGRSDHRIYFAKKVGWKWEVWFRYHDDWVDPNNGCGQWQATWARYWRWLDALEIASDLSQAYGDGVWIGRKSEFYR